MTAPISVLIPAFNAAGTLGRALDSVASQTLKPAEIIVVDDGSTDATASTAAGHPVGVRLLRHASNRGSSAALSTALGAAAHDLVAFLDADDEWRPRKLAAQLAALAETPDAALVATGFVNLGPDGRERFTYGTEASLREGADFWKALLEHSMVAKPSVLARRSLIDAVGGPDPSLRVAEDQDLWIRLALAGPVRYLPEPLLLVHEQPAGLARSQRAADLTHVLPMVERYLAKLADRLTPEETRRIRRRRYAAAATNLVAKGFWRESIPVLRIALANGEPLMPHLRHAALNLPLIRPLARKVRGG